MFISTFSKEMSNDFAPNPPGFFLKAEKFLYFIYNLLFIFSINESFFCNLRLRYKNMHAHETHTALFKQVFFCLTTLNLFLIR